MTHDDDDDLDQEAAARLSHAFEMATGYRSSDPVGLMRFLARRQIDRSRNWCLRCRWKGRLGAWHYQAVAWHSAIVCRRRNQDTTLGHLRVHCASVALVLCQLAVVLGILLVALLLRCTRPDEDDEGAGKT